MLNRKTFLFLFLLSSSCATNKVQLAKPICETLPRPILPSLKERRYMNVDIVFFLFTYERYYFEHGCYEKGVKRINPRKFKSAGVWL